VPASFVYQERSAAADLTRSGYVAAEDAEFAGGLAYFGQSTVQVGGVLGFHVNEELIFPGAAVNGPAFDFEQIYSVFRKRLEGGEQRTWTMCEAHGERRFPGFT